VITAGVDLAAQPERTAVATIRWTAGCAVIENVISRADDEVILQAVQQADKTGIDCPFGWPTAFASFVTSHQAGHVSIPSDWPSSGNLTRRRTDMFVREQLRLTPLSVAADRIAHVAFRCAVLLAKLDAAGAPVDRSGSGPVAEVYPAASPHSWSLAHHSYKQKTGTDALGVIIDQLRHEAPWLDCATHEQAMRRSHDVFDAVIAAMTARAAALGQTFPPPAGDDLAAATAEGWIAIPDQPISDLVQAYL